MMTKSDTRTKVAVLFGGRSGEHEVSLMSARSVLSVIDRERYAVIQVGITHDGAWLCGDDALAYLSGESKIIPPSAIFFADPTSKGLFASQGEGFQLFSDIDVVFPVLHGTFGEDGTLQGLFELADVAYVGAGVLGSSVGMDKGVFKDVMRASGIPIVNSILVLRSEIESSLDDVITRAEQTGAYPFFVKPANLGSSVGVNKCRSRSDLVEGLMDAAQYDRRVLIEQGVDHIREIEVSVLGNDHPTASIPGEIIPGADFYSYEAKYELETSRLFIPAQLKPEQVQRFRELAVKAFKAIDCAGMARVDFFLNDQTGEIYLNELNTIPGFTKISMYPKLWEASGLPYASLIDRLIDLALERKAQRDRTVHEFRRHA